MSLKIDTNWLNWGAYLSAKRADSKKLPSITKRVSIIKSGVYPDFRLIEKRIQDRMEREKNDLQRVDTGSLEYSHQASK